MGVAYLKNDKDIFEKFPVDFFNISRGMVGVMAGIAEIPIWCNFTYDIENDVIIGEFRSRDISIVDIAKNMAVVAMILLVVPLYIPGMKLIKL